MCFVDPRKGKMRMFYVDQRRETNQINSTRPVLLKSVWFVNIENHQTKYKIVVALKNFAQFFLLLCPELIKIDLLPVDI